MCVSWSAHFHHPRRIYWKTPQEEGCTIKTVIYLDVLLLVNFLVAYLLLQAAGVLTGQRAAFARMLTGSVCAAVSALILFAPELSYPVQIMYKLATALAIAALTFGWRDKLRLLAAACWYAALNILLAGLVVLIIFQTGTTLLQTGNLAVYLRVSPLLLLGLSGLCCGAVEVGLRFFRRRPAKQETVGLEFELCGTCIHLRAMLDTGCHLTDPITCMPVLVVSLTDAGSRLPPEIRQFLAGWFAGGDKTDPPAGAQLRLIPCSTAAQRSLLPGFAVQGIGLITENGVLGLGIVMKTHSLNPKTTRVYYELIAPDSTKVLDGYKDLTLDMRREDTVRIMQVVPRSQMWSAGQPNLYTLIVKTRFEGRINEYVPVKVGFRTVAADKGRLLVNGEPAELRVKEFEAEPQSGELDTLRKLGYNTLRLPAGRLSRELLNRCDSLGFYVVDQLPIDTSRAGLSRKEGGNPSNDPQWLDAYLDRTQQHYHAVKRHPSIVAFSLARESANGINLYESYLRLKELEPDRPVIYTESGGEWNSDRLDL